MSKLCMKIIENRLLAESEVKAASYSTMKAPSTKAKKVETPKDPSKKMTKITQVEVPSGASMKSTKSSGSKNEMGIPAAKFAGDIADTFSVPKMSSAKNEKSPATPAVQKLTPNQTTKGKEVKNTIKRTEEGKGPGANTIPQAEMAGKYVGKMGHGNTAFNTPNGKTPEVNAPKAASLNGTTRPARKAASVKDRKVDSQMVSQIATTSGKMKGTSEEPATPKWETTKKGHNVMESVQIVLNGKPKAQFGIASRQMVKRMVESYASHGYKVSITKGDKAAWKSDASLRESVFAALDAHYNNAPESAKAFRKEAQNRFASLCQDDYSSMYESRREFSQTIREGFNRMMDMADLRYRQSLEVMEGYARVEVDGDIMDMELITEARDTQMALRQFRDEIIEEYGFNANIKHIFVEGEKFRLRQIEDWSKAITESVDPKMVKRYIAQVDSIMMKKYGLDWANAAGDEEPIIQAIKAKESPSDFVDWVGEKYDLTPMGW